MLDGGVEPGSTVEEIIIAREKTGGPQRLQVRGCQLIGREHFLNHPIIALVGIERFHDPIAPMPDVFLAVA